MLLSCVSDRHHGCFVQSKNGVEETERGSLVSGISGASPLGTVAGEGIHDQKT